MDMSREILHMTLKVYFSQSVFYIASDEEDDEDDDNISQDNIKEGLTQLSKTLNVLLVNKSLYQLGIGCFHKYATINSNSVIDYWLDTDQPRLSKNFRRVPWNQLRCISYGGNIKNIWQMDIAFKQKLLPIHHLREIDVHFRSVILNSFNRNQFEHCSSMIQ